VKTARIKAGLHGLEDRKTAQAKGIPAAARLWRRRRSGISPLSNVSKHSSMILASLMFWARVLRSQYSNGPPGIQCQ
jgi:hypothetical protein